MAFNRKSINERSLLYRQIREFFHNSGYLETETPILSPDLIPETTIEAFKTVFYYQQNEQQQFLIPSPEIWMKKLLAQGSGSIFQITKCFRNCESIGKIHNPEFSMLEWYTVGNNYIQEIQVIEKLLTAIAPADTSLDLSLPFLRVTMDEAFQKHAGFKPSNCSHVSDLIQDAKHLGIPFDAADDWETAFHRIFLQCVEPNLETEKPLLLMDYPLQIPVLAQCRDTVCERWELYLNGIEIANCYTEETNPAKVASFFTTQSLKKQNCKIPAAADPGYFHYFENNFPQCCGVAMGLDRLLMVLYGYSDIGDVISFAF